MFQTRKLLSLGITGFVLLSGCAQTPLQPTVLATAGPGKSDEAFKLDQEACKSASAQTVAGMTANANRQATLGAVTGIVSGVVAGGAVAGTGADAASATVTNGAADQATIQGKYDEAFQQCMYSKGNIVPGMAPPPEAAPAPVVEGPVRSRLVRQVQQQLVRLGYLSGGADGIAGPKTADAISKYEQDHGLTVDGTSTHALLASLESQAGGQKPAAWETPPPPPPAAGPAPATQ